MSVPEGFKPTRAMIEAGIAAYGSDDDEPLPIKVANIFDCMLAAAPASPGSGSAPRLGDRFDVLAMLHMKLAKTLAFYIPAENIDGAIIDKELGEVADEILRASDQAAARIEELELALQRIDGINDNPSIYNPDIEAVLRAVLAPPAAGEIK